MTPSQSRFRELDALSRRRALTEDESLEMERCIREIDRGRDDRVLAQHRWRPCQDARLIEMRASGHTWPHIGSTLGTTTRAAEQRAKRLRAMGVRV